jgi:hypothetical protein
MWNCWLSFVSVDIGVTDGEGAFGARPLSAGCGTGFRVTILIELIEVIEVGNVLEAHGKGIDFLWIPQARIKRLCLDASGSISGCGGGKFVNKHSLDMRSFPVPFEMLMNLFSSTTIAMSACSSGIFGRFRCCSKDRYGVAHKVNRQAPKKRDLGGFNDQRGFQDYLIRHQPHL